MNDRALVDALRSRDAGALAELYDRYAESVYRYCWTLTGGPDGAQVALRDTMIAAEARIHALADPARFKVWLYALARGECLRRRSVVTPGTETDPGHTGLGAAARDAVESLPPGDREILELIHRHGFGIADAARVLAIPPRQARVRYAGAAGRLFDAVTAELRGRTAQVFGLLPEAVLPESLRVRVMSCFVDPELLPYRRLVARRIGPLDGAGFPVGPERGLARGLAAAAASVVVALALALAFAQLWPTAGGRMVAVPDPKPPTGEPAEVRTAADPAREDSPMAARPFGGRPVVGMRRPTMGEPEARTPSGAASPGDPALETVASETAAPATKAPKAKAPKAEEPKTGAPMNGAPKPAASASSTSKDLERTTKRFAHPPRSWPPRAPRASASPWRQARETHWRTVPAPVPAPAPRPCATKAASAPPHAER